MPHSKKNRAIERYWESRAGFDDEGFGTAAMWGWGSRGWDVEVCERAMVHGVSPRVEKMLAVRGWLLHHASNRRRVIYPGCGRGFHNLIGEMEAVKEKGLRCGGREV